MPAPVPFPSNISAEDMRVRYMCFMLLFHSSLELLTRSAAYGANVAAVC